MGVSFHYSPHPQQQTGLFCAGAHTFLEYPVLTQAGVCSCTLREAVRTANSHIPQQSLLASLSQTVFHLSSPKGQFYLQAKLFSRRHIPENYLLQLPSGWYYFIKKTKKQTPKHFKVICGLKKKIQVQVNLTIQPRYKMKFNHAEIANNLL